MSEFAVHDVQMQSLRSGIKLEPVISQQYSFLCIAFILEFNCCKDKMERFSGSSILIVWLSFVATVGSTKRVIQGNCLLGFRKLSL